MEYSSIISSLYGPKFFYNNNQILDGLRATDDRLILIDMDERVKVVFILVFKVLMLFKNLIRIMGGIVIFEIDKFK